MQMSTLLLLPPSVIANSALVNQLSIAEVYLDTNSLSTLRLLHKLLDHVPPILHTSHYMFQIQAAYSAGHSSADSSTCSDAIRVVRQLYVSALESGDINNWKAALLQESDVDAAHVEAIVQSVQVLNCSCEPC